MSVNKNVVVFMRNSTDQRVFEHGAYYFDEAVREYARNGDTGGTSHQEWLYYSLFMMCQQELERRGYDRDCIVIGELYKISKGERS